MVFLLSDILWCFCKKTGQFLFLCILASLLKCGFTENLDTDEMIVAIHSRSQIESLDTDEMIVAIHNRRQTESLNTDEMIVSIHSGLEWREGGLQRGRMEARWRMEPIQGMTDLAGAWWNFLQAWCCRGRPIVLAVLPVCRVHRQMLA